jgi:hypothetical protein
MNADESLWLFKARLRQPRMTANGSDRRMTAGQGRLGERMFLVERRSAEQASPPGL